VVRQRRAEDAAPRLRIVKSNELRPKDPSDPFAAAVARAMRDQHEADLLEASSLLDRPALMPTPAKFAVAIAGAALAALAYVLLYPPAPSPSGHRAATLLHALTPSAAHRAPTLTVRNHDGAVNDPLELGVDVEAAEPGATVTIKGMPLGGRLTVGEQMTLTEWRLAAEEAANAVVIPPADYVGVVNLSAELRNPDGTPVVTRGIQLSWKSAAAAAPPVGTPRRP
jgi:hypothetical protein